MKTMGNGESNCLQAREEDDWTKERAKNLIEYFDFLSQKDILT